MSHKTTMINQIDRERELMHAKPPVPPKRFIAKWGKKGLGMEIFNTYSKGRAAADWHEPEILLLCKAVDLELQIEKAIEIMETDGPIIAGSSGQPVPHPSAAMVGKLTSVQGSILRRLGIAIDGTVKPREIAKSASKARTLRKDEGDDTYASGLLA